MGYSAGTFYETGETVPPWAIPQNSKNLRQAQQGLTQVFELGGHRWRFLFRNGFIFSQLKKAFSAAWRLSWEMFLILGSTARRFRFWTVSSSKIEISHCTRATSPGKVFGTSPHGLSVGIDQANQETGCTAGDRFPAKPVLAVSDAPAVVATGADSGQPSPSPEGTRAARLFSIELTEEQRSHLAFAVLCQVAELVDSHEADEPEVQEAILCLDQVYVTLNGYRP